MKLKLLLISFVSVLSGCATMDSSFSCNETAFDSCMTIEQADSIRSKKKVNRGAKGKFSQHSDSIESKTLAGTQMVITPWVDDAGQAHSGEVLNFSSKGAL